MLETLWLGARAFTLLIAWAIGFYGSDVGLQSSDHRWSTSEDLLKGVEFERLLVAFELYKLKCNAPHAKLERTTDRPPMYIPAHWFNDYSHPKWRLPLASEVIAPHTHPGCMNTVITPDEWKVARERAGGTH